MIGQLLEAAIAAVDAGRQSGGDRAPPPGAGGRGRDAARALPPRRGPSIARELEVIVDRPAARFAAWYEMFPRSAGTDPTRSATFSEAGGAAPRHRRDGIRRRLPDAHPPHRHAPSARARTTPSTAGPDDPGVPYAIGSAEGGHDAIEPGLGTLDDFRAFVARAGALGMEIALDVALQASPDHPWAQRAPGVVHHPSRRHHPLRREPAQEVPGYLPAQFRFSQAGGSSGSSCGE